MILKVMQNKQYLDEIYENEDKFPYLTKVFDTENEGFEKLKVKIIGLIDNMSHFTGDDGKKYAIFGEGGVKKTAEEFEKEFLGEIPINSEVGKQGDLGIPIVESKPDHEISKVYLEFAKKIKSTYL